MNELIFLVHTLLVFGATFGAFLHGKDSLQALACVYVVLANLFVVKKMLLCGVVASGSDMYVVGSICAILMGSAVWGQSFAKRTGLLLVAMSVISFILCWFQVAYVPSAADTMHSVFAAALGRMPLITFFSIVAHYGAQLLALAVSGFLMKQFKGRFIFYISFAAMVLSQLVDALIFFFGVFGHELSTRMIVQMIGVSTGIKLVLILSSSLLVTSAVWCKERGYVQ